MLLRNLIRRIRERIDNADNQPDDGGSRIGLLKRILSGSGGLIGRVLFGGIGLILTGLRAYLITSPGWWAVVAVVLGLLALIIFGG